MKCKFLRRFLLKTALEGHRRSWEEVILPEGRVAVWANFCKHYAYKITSFYRNKEIIPARELGKEQHTVMEEAER